jgi:hypothetical protein
VEKIHQTFGDKKAQNICRNKSIVLQPLACSVQSTALHYCINVNSYIKREKRGGGVEPNPTTAKRRGFSILFLVPWRKVKKKRNLRSAEKSSPPDLALIQARVQVIAVQKQLKNIQNKLFVH